jgi:hypothetical protein
VRLPDASTVPDSLVDAYESGGRVDLAAPLYERAYLNAQKIKDPNLELFKANFDRATAKLKKP